MGAVGIEEVHAPTLARRRETTHHQTYRFGRTSILRVQRRKLALEVLLVDVVGQQGQFVATVDEVGEHRAEKFRCRAVW